MNNYPGHLEELSNAKTIKRKKDYIDYNFRIYLEKLGFKNIKVLDMGPGLGEFEGYLNDRGVSNIDIIDNDKSVVAYVPKEYKIRKSYFIKDISLIDKQLGTYNFIFLMQVLEYLSVDKYETTLQILYKHLEREGFLIIVVPNGNNPLGLIERYADLQHTSFFTEQSLKDLINAAGIEDYQIKIKGYEIPPYNPMNILRIFLQKILHLFLPLLMIINGGTFFKTMTPNIVLIIKRN